MKRLIYLASILLAGAMITMYSCTKQNEVSKNDQCTTCQDGRLLAEKINHFKAQLLRAKDNPKDGEVMTKEEAIKNMELLINASHGFPFEDYTERKTDSLSFQMEVDANGKISLYEVANKYDEMKEMVKNAYLNSGFTEKGLILVQLSQDPDDTSGKTIDLTVTTGKRGVYDPAPFTQAWYYGENLGLWNGGEEGKDGGDTIASTLLINNPIFSYFDKPGENFHLILDTLIPIERVGNEYVDENGDYLIFFYQNEDGQYTDLEKKLSVDDMNKYYNNEYEVVYSIVPNEFGYTFPDYVLVGCIIDGNDGAYNGISTLKHYNILTYAERYWVEDDIISPPHPIDSN